MHEEGNEHWTLTHDVALVLIGLAYGSDRDLSDEEANTLTTILAEWAKEFESGDPGEIAMEALAIYLEQDTQTEVIHAIRTLGTTLTDEQKERLLEDAVRLAQADGVLLARERSLVSILSTEWALKSMGTRLMTQGSTREPADVTWTLMHDMSLLYVVVAHSTDSDLSRPEIDTMVSRLKGWQPDMTDDDVRRLVAEALRLYSKGPDAAMLQGTVTALRDALPLASRLVLLDDLVCIARSDGAYDSREREMIGILASAWHINIRLNGRGHSDQKPV